MLDLLNKSPIGDTSNLESWEIWLRICQYIFFRYLLLAGGVFLLFYHFLKKYNAKNKIQKKMPAKKGMLSDIFYSGLSIIIFASMAFHTLNVLKEYTHVYSPAEKYGYWYYAFTYVWMFFLHDAYFYFVHRLMHHPKIFTKVHLIHHKATNPTPWTSYAFHPLETLLEAAIIPLIAFTLPVNTIALVLFLFFQFVFNVYAHLGYELIPKRIQNRFPSKWINTSIRHNNHHQFFHGNYGLYTTIWDHLFGTLSDKE